MATAKRKRRPDQPRESLTPRSMLVKVRCLGPGKEHTFLSEDKKTNRICGRCRRLASHRNDSGIRECAMGE